MTSHGICVRCGNVTTLYINGEWICPQRNGKRCNELADSRARALQAFAEIGSAMHVHDDQRLPGETRQAWRRRTGQS